MFCSHCISVSMTVVAAPQGSVLHIGWHSPPYDPLGDDIFSTCWCAAAYRFEPRRMPTTRSHCPLTRPSLARMPARGLCGDQARLPPPCSPPLAAAASTQVRRLFEPDSSRPARLPPRGAHEPILRLRALPRRSAVLGGRAAVSRAAAPRLPCGAPPAERGRRTVGGPPCRGRAAALREGRRAEGPCARRKG